MRIEINNISEINKATAKFIGEMGENSVFALYGAMGTGKTTFIKAVCKELGVEETITSPTFAIVNEYKDRNGDSIFHFDFYRINKLEEVYDFGYEDYFYSGNLCFIEWPELVESLLPENCIRINISETENGVRIIETFDSN